MSVIEISDVTKDYGGGKGVFDLNFTVEKGEILGFLGPNGAGKTTTVRQLLGFIRPDRGSVRINGMDCIEKADEIERSLGYLPGEIAFIDSMTGIDFIAFIAKMKGMRDLHYADELIRFFELDASGRIKKMSKGMKQKIGIVCAFMQDPQLLILDEPTSGLDPLMQNKFIELILREKQKGKTILMSSHIFEEVERTCDRAVIIKDGRIVAQKEISELRQNKKKVFEIRFADAGQASRFAEEFSKSEREGNLVRLSRNGRMDSFIKTLGSYTVEDLDIRSQTLEEFFLHFYGGDEQ